MIAMFKIVKKISISISRLDDTYSKKIQIKIKIMISLKKIFSVIFTNFQAGMKKKKNPIIPT